MARATTTLVPWFGSNRSLAHHVGAQLADCTHATVLFGGGLCELRHLTARTIIVSDLHRHVINLANVLQDDDMGPAIIRQLRRLPFHEDTLRMAQQHCLACEATTSKNPDPAWALSYFVASWMGRSGKAGTDDEFASKLSVRWDAGGGDSATRFRSAVESLRDWRKIMPRCTFVVMDCFAMLDKVKDQDGCGLYSDSPFPSVGDAYTHHFTDAQHRELARRLAVFTKTRVVCRFYRHPLVEELYPTSRWHWLELKGGRTQANKQAPEVLLVNGEPLAGKDTA